MTTETAAVCNGPPALPPTLNRGPTFLECWTLRLQSFSVTADDNIKAHKDLVGVFPSKTQAIQAILNLGLESKPHWTLHLEDPPPPVDDMLDQYHYGKAMAHFNIVDEDPYINVCAQLRLTRQLLRYTNNITPDALETTMNALLKDCPKY